MRSDFADIFRGLMENRRLSPSIVGRATGRAETTVSQLMSGALPPRPDLLEILAPVLQMELADLLVIAGLPVNSPSGHPTRYATASELGSLVNAATALNAEQIEQLIKLAITLRNGVGD